MARKSTGKRLRFEVFKRDGFRCVYCGATPMQAMLHADHVVAVANGGSNDASNLVTSCRDCNQGKSAVPLERRALKTGDPQAAQEHAEQLKAYLAAQREIDAAKRDAESMILDRWAQLCGEWHWTLPRYLPGAVRSCGVDGALEAVEIVARRGLSGAASVRYFCGILRRMRKERAAAAEQTAEDMEQLRYAEGLTMALDCVVRYCCGKWPPVEWRDVVRRAHVAGVAESKIVTVVLDRINDRGEGTLDEMSRRIFSEIELLAIEHEPFEGAE